MMRKLLVANRGEIACRVISSARSQGLHTVAIYSEADADARHVQLADEAVLIGPAPVAESYLDMDRILAAAKASGAEAIHPGYGFLSERAAFAEACADAGIVFVGPDPQSIRLMGDKAESKDRMIAAGVPCIPGYQGDDQSEATFAAEAARIGYPVMVKASAGGGGRGMRLVNDPIHLSAALKTARSEAEGAFGDGRLLLERAVIEPRHVEIQVFGDRHGNVIHLFERDCSIQRRHQKVVEEAPSPAVSDSLRAAMGAAAVQAAKSIGYVGAGTVEFLLAPDGQFYFLEMNTRLQVEHPVTEMVTGLDLVALQLAVADGKPLPITQDDVTLTGHAIEIRLYAEAPEQDFLPQTGTIAVWEPAIGEGIRIDHGLVSGTEVSPYYDPMLAKLIAWGPDRTTASRRLLRAVEDSRIFGVATNRAFLVATLSMPEFVRGEATTAFIARNFPDGFAPPEPPAWGFALAAALLCERDGDGWRSNQWTAHPVKLDEEWLVSRDGDGWWISSASSEFHLSILSRSTTKLCVAIDGHSVTLGYHCSAGAVELDIAGDVRRYVDRTYLPPAIAEAAGTGTLRAPMNGTVMTVEVAEGDVVVRGQLLLVLEAMKMEHQIVAPIDGVVETVAAGRGAQVATRDILVVIAP